MDQRRWGKKEAKSKMQLLTIIYPKQQTEHSTEMHIKKHNDIQDDNDQFKKRRKKSLKMNHQYREALYE